MTDIDKTKEQLLSELVKMRQRVAELEPLETDRKRIEEALRREKERVEGYLNIAGLMLATVSADENITLMNKKGCEILGYKEGELIGKNWFDTLVPERIKDEIRATFRTLMAGNIEPVESYENPLLTKGGEERLIAFHNTVIRDPNGQIVGALLSAEDITEHKRAEEMLKASEEKYKQLAESISDVFFAFDEELRYTYWNKASEELTGISAKDALGKHLHDVFPDTGMTRRAEKFYLKALRTKQPQHFVNEYQLGGKDFVFEISIYPSRSGLSVFVKDITERKQAEEREQQLQHELNITSRLATLGEMASGIAHEINNPLTGVVGFANLLLKKDIPEDIRKDVNIIYEGAQRIATITSRMLDFARQHKPERTSVNINESIETSLAMRTYEMQSSNIKVNTQLDPDLPQTTADAGQLQQVFVNIILNAETEMKMAHDKGNLSVKTERIDNTIRISFKDDGPGIPKKNLEKIFDPFFTTREVGQGAGLGLSVCHGIVSQHSGKIYAESKLGKGATFIVELPIVTQAEELRLAEPAGGEVKRVSGAKILVVDDDLIVQQFLTEVLTEEGHDVEIIDNGDDALERLGGEDYDVILLDVKLPGMSGIDLYKHMQKAIKSLARRVIFISGDVMGRDTMAFLSRTKAPYITKPFVAEQLKKDIGRILSQQS